MSCSDGGDWFGGDTGGTTDTTMPLFFNIDPPVEPTPIPEVPKSIDTISVSNLSKRLLDASVTVLVYDTKKKLIQLGSGVFVQSNIIATNFHVVKGGSYFCIERGAQKNLIQAEIYKYDETHDVGLLKIDESFPSSVLSLNSNLPQPGIDIRVAGSPMGLTGTISGGIVSAIRTNPPLDDDLIQITASISHGSSGGPVVNMKGEILGISVSKIGGQDAQNLNFAVPAKYIEFLLP